ncbi:MAG: hypothetical protein ACI9F9_003465 [Candidatus Paceibacteria bacterium]|jgi:hypothetical protein
MIDNIQSLSTVQTLLPSRPLNLPEQAQGRKTDQISISKLGMGQSLKAMQEFMQAELDKAFPAPEKEKAEKAQVLYPSGSSPQQVSGTIFRGVSQVIFGAYKRSHPEMSEKELEQFMSQVMQGIDKGVEDARNVLGSMEGGLGEETGEAIDSTLNLLKERLSGWFEETRSEMFAPQEA